MAVQLLETTIMPTFFCDLSASLDISIIICTRNRAQSLSGTLESLAAIRTEYQWEALVVDNASTDRTAVVIAAADKCGGRLRYLYESRVGLGAARDGAWRQAKCQILCFTDDDCYLTPGFIDAMIAAFAERPRAGCIGGRILRFDSTDAPITIDERTQPLRTPPYSFVYPGMLQGANMAFRREALQASGGFDPTMGAGTPYPCEDIDALAAVLWSGYEAWFDPRPLIYHHHRRKAADLPNLIADYGRGRGAFYAKYVARRETRWLFMRKWIASPKHNLHYDFDSFRIEVGSALRYTRQFHGTAAQLRIRGVAAGMLIVLMWVRMRSDENI
jgi:GT2 family glycosyltransferase